jgi:hypothetical protein
VREEDLGIVLPTSPETAVTELAAQLSEPPRLDARAAAALRYAEQHFSPRRVALAYLTAYELGVRPSGGAGRGAGPAAPLPSPDRPDPSWMSA